MDDEEFERRWREDGEPQEREVSPVDRLSTEWTTAIISGIMFSLGLLFIWVSAYNLLPFKGLSVFVPFLVVVGMMEYYRRKEQKKIEAESKLTDADLDKLLGREVQ